MTTNDQNAPVPIRHIAQSIRADLAALYGVPTKRFNEQVRRNWERFPADFMFQLTEEEFSALRSHFATSNEKPAGRGSNTNSKPMTRLSPEFSTLFGK